MARTKGSKNGSTKMKESIQKQGMAELKNKTANVPKVRIIVPRGIAVIDSNFRYLIDPLCYILQRKIKPGENITDSIDTDELIDDEEVEVIDKTTEKDKDKWGYNKYFNNSYSGLKNMREHVVTYYIYERFSNKRISSQEHIDELKKVNEEIKILIGA